MVPYRVSNEKSHKPTVRRRQSRGLDHVVEVTELRALNFRC